MKKTALFAIMILLLMGCRNHRNAGFDIRGNWFFLDMDTFPDDTLYMEVFINDTSFVYFSEMTGIMVSRYKIIDNSICLYSLCCPIRENVPDTFLITITDNQHFLLKSPDHHIKIKYTRIKPEDGEITFDRMMKYSCWDENKEYDRYEASFLRRQYRALYGKPYPSDTVIVYKEMEIIPAGEKQPPDTMPDSVMIIFPKGN